MAASNHMVMPGQKAPLIELPGQKGERTNAPITTFEAHMNGDATVVGVVAQKSRKGHYALQCKAP